MKFISFIIPLTAVFASASSVPVTHSSLYDRLENPSTTRACGARLADAGYPTFGSLPSFPNIGRSPAVGIMDSSVCGSCWNLSYTWYDWFGDKTIVAIYVTVIDVDPASEGFIISREALANLAGQKAVDEGSGQIYASATRVQGYHCGFDP
jgi:hypothetical protein